MLWSTQYHVGLRVLLQFTILETFIHAAFTNAGINSLKQYGITYTLYRIV